MPLALGAPSAVVFDLGGVLVAWDPRHLYRKLIPDETALEAFLGSVCTDEWNAQQDAGRSTADGTDDLVTQFPEHEDLIRAYYGRWIEMVPGPIDGAESLIRDLKKAGVPLLGLSNCAQETFETACEAYPFLNLFDDWVVSAREKVMKPDPEIYRIVTGRSGYAPHQLVFVDDRIENVEGARSQGWQGHHFKEASLLRNELASFGLLAG
ncbi:HAD family phosphatase [Magnetospira sp. QH-2]|uniref:HAD family hydrolase n=1 Tax=Magnetospira sp. (strain QH-2) TaxID=1288970 RepID=UPI0003E815A1|nr:HAD family phosphatase [Magnetospira sp. QH-2]CCQ74647.1 Putative hydrolase, haloacid dehalogenase-like family [Magnetospira sp. QH-2]